MANKNGETRIANNGQKMTIVAYRGSEDIDVKFEDGTVVTGKAYSSFVRGCIRNPNVVSPRAGTLSRLGETVTANNGQKMTIVAYRNSKDVDVQFEDGTIVTNKNYHNFQVGEIWNPNCATVRVPKNNRTGETKISKNGQRMTIINYENYNDIDIQFEDGTIVYHRGYNAFKTGAVENPHLTKQTKDGPVGETSVAKNGLKMTIVAYHNTRNVDILFEDGVLVNKKRYRYFKTGQIAHPNVITKRGRKAKF